MFQESDPISMKTTRNDRSVARTTSRSGSALRSRCAETAARSGWPPLHPSLRASRLPEARATRCRTWPRSGEPSRPGRPSWTGSRWSSSTTPKRWRPTPFGTSWWGSGTRWFSWPKLRRWDRARWTRPGCRTPEPEVMTSRTGEKDPSLAQTRCWQKNKIPLIFVLH